MVDVNSAGQGPCVKKVILKNLIIHLKMLTYFTIYTKVQLTVVYDINTFMDNS